MMDATVHLDPRIRNWVFIPIFIVVFAQHMVRIYLTLLLRDEKKVDVENMEKMQLLRRSQRLRMSHHVIPPSAFRMRKNWLIQKAFAQGDKKTAPDPREQQDPMAMMGVMKQQIAMLVPHLIFMAWVNHFFYGFVLAKVPFPLTENFKSMTQQGIFLRTLDPSYVSSLSWYFLNVFGQRGCYQLVLGPGVAPTEAQMIQQQQMGMSRGPGQQPDYNKLFNVEKRDLKILSHTSTVIGAEYRLLGKPVPPNLQFPVSTAPRLQHTLPKASAPRRQISQKTESSPVITDSMLNEVD